MNRVAVVQTFPVVGDTPATIAKVAGLIRDAGKGGAEVAVFPEALIGATQRGAALTRSLARAHRSAARNTRSTPTARLALTDPS